MIPDVQALLFHNRFGGTVVLVCCRVFFPPPGSTLAFGVALLSQSVGIPEATSAEGLESEGPA